MLGGIDNSNAAMKDLYRYDTINATWTRLSDIPSPVAYFTAGMSSLEFRGDCIFVAGGTDGVNVNEKIYLYSIKSDTWTESDVVTLATVTVGMDGCTTRKVQEAEATYSKFVSKAAGAVTSTGMIVRIGGIDNTNVVNEDVVVFKTADEVCESSDHMFVVSKCTNDNKRSKDFMWLDAAGLPGSEPGSCVVVPSAYQLPSSIEVDCSYVTTSSTLGMAVTALSLVGAAWVCFSLVFLVIFWRSPIIKMSQPPFVVMSMMGCVGMCLANLTNLGEMSDGSCMSRLMTFNICFTVMFAPLFAKTYRVYRVVSNIHLKKANTDISVMLIVVVLIIILDIIILVIWGMVDPEKAVDEESSTVGVYDTMCKSEGSAGVVNILYKAAITLYGCYISFLTRDYKPAIAESKFILFCMYVIIIMGLLVGVVMNLESTVQTVVTIQAIATVIGSITLSTLIVGPKILMRNLSRNDLISGGLSTSTNSTGQGATATGGNSNPSDGASSLEVRACGSLITSQLGEE